MIHTSEKPCSITVVIPCYNQGKYLAESIGSVLSQTIDDVEILIVNDGSTDPETIEVLNTLAYPKTRLIHTTNQGLAAARNNGIREAKGRYILPLDADDRIGPTYLEQAVRILDENPGIGIVYCRAAFFGAVEKPWNLPEFSLSEMLIDNILFCSCVFRKADWELVGGYRTDMIYGWEDYDFWLSLIERGRLVHRIPEELFFYRISPESMLRTKTREQKIEMYERVFHHHREFFERNIRLWIDRLIDIPVDRTRKWMAQVYVDTGMGFNEKQTVVAYVGGDERNLEFDLSRFDRIQGIRIDPVNSPAVVCLYRIVLKDASGREQTASIRSHNALLEEDGHFVFTSTDPHWIIEGIDGPARSIRVELDFLAIGNEAFDRLLHHQNVRIAELQQTLHEKSILVSQQRDRLVHLETVLQDKDRAIQDKDRAIQDKDRHIRNIEFSLNRIKGSLIWRTADFCRKWMVFFPIDLARKSFKAADILRREGMRGLFHHLWLHLTKADRQQAEEQPAVVGIGLTQADYEAWMATRRLSDDRRNEIRRQIAAMPVKPKISVIVPVYEVDGIWLEKAIQSVVDQVYDNWELCLADDASPSGHIREILQKWADREPRIRVHFLTRNRGIALASNAAAQMATGDFIGFLDHDDTLSPDALFEVASVLQQHPQVDLVYSDEDKMDLDDRRIEPFFKPDYSPDLLLSQNYICHFTVVRKTLFDTVGGFRDGFNGSQDHDLILRILEKTDQVAHIPNILYHWRKIPGSTAAVYDAKSYAWEAGRKAIEQTLKARGVEASVFCGRWQGSYRVKRRISGQPLVSILIPFRDRADLLETCILSVLEKSSWPAFEIIGIDNGSSAPETAKLMQRLADMDARVTFLPYRELFNYSAINNFAVSQAKGEHVVLMNSDIEIITPSWIEALLEHSQRPEVGAVGAKLYYPDGRIQHAGIVVGMFGNAGHPHRFFQPDDNGYYARPHVIHNVSAVTAALMMVKKSLYESVGGLDAAHLGIAYNDVDFCLKLRQKGLLNVFTPYCEAIHHESASRGYESTSEKRERFERERQLFESRWAGVIDAGDPYYNVNLSLKSEDFAIRLEREP
ncbi:glycosyltransferase [Desulfatirhabdium butyrativorans]|uniref:glycosyltransferase n=1 Tax=Desulfatirhabdium butyrativorans TaxID=340467 RepID=UPI00040559E9|nr:glycosyltransferase [Desulfatirhabdium butyrativorans]